jgi:hypothetical protein
MKRGKLTLIENMDFEVVIDMISNCSFWTSNIYLDNMFCTMWILSYFWSIIIFIFLNDKMID